MVIKEENLLEELSEEVKQIVDTSKDVGLDKYETAYAVACYEDFGYNLEEVLEMIDSGVISTSSWDSHYIENSEWNTEAYVFDNYEDAESAAKEDVLNLFDDIGFEGINVDLENFADQDWFKDALVESFEFYCRGIVYENDDTYGNRLVQECYDNDLIDDESFEKDENGEPDYTQCIIDEDELVDRYVAWYEDDLNSSYAGDFVQAYIDDFGARDLSELIKNNPSIIDTDALAEYIVDDDGVANSLARYDGNEYEVEIGDGVTYYVYRAN